MLANDHDMICVRNCVPLRIAKQNGPELMDAGLKTVDDCLEGVCHNKDVVVQVHQGAKLLGKAKDAELSRPFMIGDRPKIPNEFLPHVIDITGLASLLGLLLGLGQFGFEPFGKGLVPADIVAVREKLPKGTLKPQTPNHPSPPCCQVPCLSGAALNRFWQAML